MAKIRGEALYAEKGDELFEMGKNGYPNADKIEKFLSEILDKTFDNWILVARDADLTSFKEMEKGNLLTGVVFYNIKGKPTEESQERSNKSSIKHLNKKGQIAMMLLDVIEGICENEEETEDFLEALHETAKHLHQHKDDDEIDEADYKKESLEVAKLKVLKGFLDTSIDCFDTFDGKVKFIKSCLGSVLPAKILESGGPELKQKLRESMKASISGDKSKGSFAMDTVDKMVGVVDAVLDAMDEGKNAQEIAEVMREFAGALGADKSKIKFDLE